LQQQLREVKVQVSLGLGRRCVLLAYGVSWHCRVLGER
jgi:hypothetical protein